MNAVQWAVALWQLDRRRRGVTGEHAFALGMGLGLLRRARRGGFLPFRALAAVAGLAFVIRAASGRDGLRRLANGRTTVARRLAPRDRVGAQRGSVR